MLENGVTTPIITVLEGEKHSGLFVFPSTDHIRLRMQRQCGYARQDSTALAK